MKLSDLPGKYQEEIIARRLEETKMLQNQALRSNDPLLLHTCWLDAEARQIGFNIEYSEDLEPEEEC